MNTRARLLVLSGVDCGFGAVSLATDGAISWAAYGVNIAIALVLMMLTSRDLQRRGLTWTSLAVGISYLVAPLIGLVLYAVASRHPQSHGALAA